MDIPRALVITGIAVVSYLMIQAWQQDYMSPQTTPVAQEQTLADDTAPANDSDPLPQPDSAEGSVPEPVEEQQAQAPAPDSESSDSAQRIEVNTDVLSLEINPVGGDIERVALPEYPRHADTPNQPFVLMQNDAARTYVAQSGLVGKNGTDTAEGRPTWQTSQKRYRLQDGRRNSTWISPSARAAGWRSSSATLSSVAATWSASAILSATTAASPGRARSTARLNGTAARTRARHLYPHAHLPGRGVLEPGQAL